MVLYDLTQEKFEQELNKINSNHEYFLLISPDEFYQVQKLFDIHFEKMRDKKILMTKLNLKIMGPMILFPICFFG